MFFGSAHGGEREALLRADRHLLVEWYQSGSVSAPYPERTAGIAFQPS